MTTGAVIFAQNTPEFDYVKLSIYAASRIKKYLDIPVSLVTDSRRWLEKTYPNHEFDHVVDIPTYIKEQTKLFHDGTLTSSVLTWKNLTRSMVYDLSPYDTTLVIDSDYIINSSNLKPALERDYDLQIYKGGIDLSGWRSNEEFRRINQYSIPFYWATTFIFQKSVITKGFFDLVEYIRVNWAYFKILYNVDDSVFRNDFAFSMAIHIMNGKTNGEFATDLPGSMIYSVDRDLLVDINDSTVKLLVEKKDHKGEYIMAKTNNLDVHIMNKYSLSRFIDGGCGV